MKGSKLRPQGRAVSVVFFLLLWSSVSAATFEHVSVTAAGDAVSLPNWNATPRSISADGRLVLFSSAATNLLSDLPPPTSTLTCWYIRDRVLGVTRLLGEDPLSGFCLGRNEGSAAFSGAALSGDGRFAAVVSSSPALVVGDTNDGQDLFVLDLDSGAYERVNVSSDGSQATAVPRAAANAMSHPQIDSVSLSHDGRFVAFRSQDTSIVAGDDNWEYDVFLRDRLLGTTQRVSLTPDGGQRDRGARSLMLSADGRFVVYDGGDGIYVFDREAQATELVSVNSAGEPANLGFGSSSPPADRPAISGDGRLVAFWSQAVNLDENRVPGRSETSLYLHDRATGRTERVTSPAQRDFRDDLTATPSFSHDGRHLVFDSHASTLVAGDTNSESDLFVRDDRDGTFRRVSVGPNGAEVPRYLDCCKFGLISGDGQTIVFASRSNIFMAADLGLPVANSESPLKVFAVANPAVTDPPGRGIVGYRDLIAIEDIDRSGDPEVVALGVLADRSPIVVVMDAGTGEEVMRAVLPPSSKQVRGIARVDDVNGNGSPEVAVLLATPDGRARIHLLDTSTGAWLGRINGLAPGWSAISLSGLRANLLGGPELLLLGRRHDGGGQVIQALDVRTGRSVGWLPLEESTSDIDAAPDFDGDGFDDLAVLSNASVRRTRILDAETGDRLAAVPFDPWTLQGIDTIAVLKGENRNGSPWVAGLSGTNQQLVVYDVRTKERVGRMYARLAEPIAVAAVDADGDGIDDVAVLGKAGGVWKINVFDARSSAWNNPTKIEIELPRE